MRSYDSETPARPRTPLASSTRTGRIATAKWKPLDGLVEMLRITAVMAACLGTRCSRPERQAGGGWETWLQREQADLDKIDAFIRKGSYRTGYEGGIETSLGQVRKSI